MTDHDEVNPAYIAFCRKHNIDPDDFSSSARWAAFLRSDDMRAA